MVGRELGTTAAVGSFRQDDNKVLFTYYGAAICIAMEGQIEVWHMRENKRLYRRSVRGDRTSVLPLPDGGMLIASTEGLQRVELDNPDAVVHFVGHRSDVWGIALDPNGPTVASYSRDKSIRFWDARNGTSLWKMEMKTDINAVSIASTGKRGVAK